MIALRYHGVKDVRLDEVDVPKPKADEILVKVRACGICATDQHIRETGMWMDKVPMTLGHEASLEVVEMGEDVQGDRDFLPLKVGDIITAEDVTGCGKCYYCNRGWQNLCNNVLFPGISSEGFFSTYQVIPWNSVHKAPKGLSDLQVACAEPAAGGLHAVKNAGVKIGDTVAIFGCGPIGLFQLQAAKNAGAEVIAVDVADFKLGVAKKLGADIVLNGKKEDVVKYVLDYTDGFGVDVAIESVGGIPDLVRNALAITKKRGMVTVMGLGHKTDVPIDLSGTKGLILREITLRGTVGHSFWPDAPADFKVVMKLMKRGKIDVEPIVTHKFSLRNWEEAFDLPADKRVKVMFTEFE